MAITYRELLFTAGAIILILFLNAVGIAVDGDEDDDDAS